MKIFRRLVFCFIAVLLLYMTVTVGGIYKYLKEYGYSAYALPQTLAVYYGLSDGFTIYEIPDSDTSVFIGNHNYIYEKIFNKHGYHEVDRLGLVGYYKKDDNSKEAYDFEITSQNEWCHWFRIYRINKGFKIEDFK